MKKDPSQSKNAKKARSKKKATAKPQTTEPSAPMKAPKPEEPKPQPLQKIVIQAQYNFSDAEIVVLSREQTGLYNEITRLKDQLAHVSKDYRSKIAGIEARQKELINKIGSGYEMRDTDVFVEMFPKQRIKKYFRITPTGEKGEFIREESMSPSDYVVEMKLNDPRRPKPPEQEKDKDGAKQPGVQSDGSLTNTVLPPTATADNPSGKPPESTDGEKPAKDNIIDLEAAKSQDSEKK